jgi:FHS family Na+ dependent glucose MFS transporter 1
MAAGLVGMAAVLAVVPLIPMLWVLTIALFFLGLSEGVFDVGGNTLLVWVHQSKVGPFMNGLHFFFGVGAFLAPVIIARLVLVSGDITSSYWVLAFLMLPTAAGLLFQSSPAPAAVARSSRSGPVQPGLIILIALMFFLFVGVEGSYGGWIFTYAFKLKLANETSAAYLTSAFWGALTAGRLLGIPIAARFHPRSILFADMLVALLGCGLAWIGANSLIAVWAGTLLVGFGIASMFPTALALAERSFPLSGKITSWFFVGSSLGGMLLPWLIGQMIEPIGTWTMMLVLISALLIALVILTALVNLIRRSPKPAVI